MQARTHQYPCPSPGQPLYGQDANYTINPMSYTKLGENGVKLPDSATEWFMVRDNVTGLIWEMKTEKDGTQDYSNAHDADNTYTWRDSDPATNGGYIGTTDDGTDTESFTNTLNRDHFGGYSDWRIPTIKELDSIVNYNIPYPGPTIDTSFFPDIQSFDYWSSTNYAYNFSSAWSMHFYYGYNDHGQKDSKFYVRAVRGKQYQPAFVDNYDGTVSDTSTGLMWQKETPDDTITWEQALSYCENLELATYTDWRLPTQKELRNLVDYSRYNPAINTDFFPFTFSSFYWSSTTSAQVTSAAWGEYFFDGYDLIKYKSSKNYVRAVRRGQPEPIAICHDVTTLAGQNCSANASIDNGSFDPEGGQITLSQSPSGPYPLGNTLVTLTVTDDKGESSQCTGTVTVVDATPPKITETSADPSVIWPPNKKMVMVTIHYDVKDNCSQSTCRISCVTSDEPINNSDYFIVNAHHVKLRADRLGRGNDRIYKITIKCTDDAGNSSNKTVKVTVPHDQRRNR